MKYKRFEELPVWNAAIELAVGVFALTAKGCFRGHYGTRNQLENATVSVSNNIAEGFERTTTAELLQFLGFARGSAGEVRSMMAVVGRRPRLQSVNQQLVGIRTLAESCAKQLQGWRNSIEGGRVQGSRYLSAQMKQNRAAMDKAAEFRRNFLRQLKPEHPLYKSPEARAARGEPPEN